MTPAQYAVYRHVWALAPNHFNMLDKYFLLRCLNGNFLDKLEELAPKGKDIIDIQGNRYEVEYLNCGYQSLYDLNEAEVSFASGNVVGIEDRVLLISCRISLQYNIRVALVYLTEAGYVNDKLPWLE